MKPVLLTILLTGALMAQTKSAPKAAPKSAAAPNLLNPASLNRTAPATFRVKLTTTKGDVIIEVTRAWAPRGADRFYNLVRAGYLHRCRRFSASSPNFMAQFGISARPEVSKAACGTRTSRTIREARIEQARQGDLRRPPAGPIRAATQLFINMRTTPSWTPTGSLPFGEVVEGMENVDSFYTGYGEQPRIRKLIRARARRTLDRQTFRSWIGS